MKQLLTLTALLISSLAMGQWPSLPYNPDENGDGLIGVVDLQGLLANYGNEFEGAVVSLNGESAIVYVGDSKQIQCKYDCAHLPGRWHLPEPYELVPVMNDIAWVNGSGCTYAWISDYGKEVTNNTLVYRACNYQGSLTFSGVDFSVTARCYCAAKQLPRVEYSACEGSNIQDCCASKVSEGWYPLGNPTSAAQNNSPFYRWNQSFWRWAE